MHARANSHARMSTHICWQASATGEIRVVQVAPEWVLPGAEPKSSESAARRGDCASLPPRASSAQQGESSPRRRARYAQRAPPCVVVCWCSCGTPGQRLSTAAETRSGNRVSAFPRTRRTAHDAACQVSPARGQTASPASQPPCREMSRCSFVLPCHGLQNPGNPVSPPWTTLMVQAGKYQIAENYEKCPTLFTCKQRARTQCPAFRTRCATMRG